jgi:hypothetical protein
MVQGQELPWLRRDVNTANSGTQDCHRCAEAGDPSQTTAVAQQCLSYDTILQGKVTRVLGCNALIKAHLQALWRDSIPAEVLGERSEFTRNVKLAALQCTNSNRRDCLEASKSGTNCSLVISLPGVRK